MLICPHCRKTLQRKKEAYFCISCQKEYPLINGIPSFIIEENVESAFHPEMCAELSPIEKQHFWHTGRKEIIYALLKKLFKKSLIKKKMIEIGCGNGTIIQHLRNNGIRIEGGDVSLYGLQRCKQQVNAPLYHINALQTPFPDNSYDIIGLFDVLEHIEEDQKLLKEMYRICKKDGILFITVPAFQFLWSYFDIYSKHKRRYSKENLIKKVTDAGFKIKKISFYMFFLFLPYLLIRKMPALFKIDAPCKRPPMKEVSPPRWINTIFLSIFRIEKKLLPSINLPFGSSLLCLSKKD